MIAPLRDWGASRPSPWLGAGLEEVLGRRKKARKARLVPEREANGRFSRAGEAPQERGGPWPAQLVRLRTAALSGATDARWGTVLGQLYLRGDIDAAMCSAGFRWAELVSRYHGAIGTPPGNRSLQIDAPRGGEPPDPDSETGAKLARRERKAVAAFLDAHARLIAATLSSRLPVESVVRAASEHETWPAGWREHQALKIGLAALVLHWNLTPHRK